LDGIGAGYASICLPGAPGLQGTLLHAQWLVLGQEGSAPGGLSDALEWWAR